jgi:hypothetical protein
MMVAGHKIAGLEVPGRWVDVRDPDVLAQLETEQPPPPPPPEPPPSPPKD